MMDIILVRHGQTALNLAEVFRGRLDVDLDESGLQQAKLLGEYLSHRHLEAVYTSPLRRALHTAEAIARPHSLAINTAPELSDIDFGEWQGLSHQQVRKRFADDYRQWRTSPHLAKMPSGESLEEVRQRAMPVVEKIVARHTGTVALVSHRVVSKVLICALLGLDNSHFWNIRLDTCGMTTFDYEKGQFVLTEHNNRAFLGTSEEQKLSDF